MRGTAFWRMMQRDPKRWIGVGVLAAVMCYIAFKRHYAVSAYDRAFYTLMVALPVIGFTLLVVIWTAQDGGMKQNKYDDDLMNAMADAIIEQKKAEKAREEAAKAQEAKAPVPKPAQEDPPAPPKEEKTAPPPPEPEQLTPEQQAMRGLDLEGHEFDTPEEFRQFLEEQIGPELTEKLADKRELCIPLCFEQMPEEEIPVGASKRGGMPDLPPSIHYPTLSAYRSIVPMTGTVREEHAEAAMQLILQINLKEVHDPLGRLPEEGMLYLFWSGEDCPLISNKWLTYEFQGENRETFRVIYYGGLEQLERTPAPCGFDPEYYDGALPSERITFEEPCWDIDAEAFGAYNGDVIDFEDCNQRGDKLFGIPAFLCNASPPGDGWRNLYQFDFERGCLMGIWWYMREEALRSGAPKDAFQMETDVD